VTATTGWCDNTAHPRHDHLRTDACTGFVSDDENTAALRREAARHDARTAYSPEAAYVSQHRPY
jgi:hypothetical protein